MVIYVNLLGSFSANLLPVSCFSDGGFPLLTIFIRFFNESFTYKKNIYISTINFYI